MCVCVCVIPFYVMRIFHYKDINELVRRKSKL